MANITERVTIPSTEWVFFDIAGFSSMYMSHNSKVDIRYSFSVTPTANDFHTLKTGEPLENISNSIWIAQIKGGTPFNLSVTKFD